MDEIIASSDNITIVNIHENHRAITFEEVIEHLDYISTSPLFCSLISYVVRAERFQDKQVYEEQIDKIIRKELQAAMVEDRPQGLRYDGLFNPSVPLQDDGSRNGGEDSLLKAFQRGIKGLKRTFEKQDHIFIPHYSRKRNMGWETQQNLLNSRNGYQYVGMGVGDINARDLMIHYHETGEQIQGPMEMRHAWRYNDLKGRCYYAGGGTALWAGLFVKSIVKDILNLLPNTHTFSRYDADRVTFDPLRPGEVLVTYDYSSFTTNLAELKYFLSYLAILLEDVNFRSLDVFEGVQDLNLGEYIYEYNKTININAEFDIRRIADYQMLVNLHQVKSGMLGAQGNIGFSTLLHGLSMSGISTRPLSSCVVGDDALFRVWKHLLNLAMTRSQYLAPIEISKFHIWEPCDFYTSDGPELSNEQAWQFLKRPLQMDIDGHLVTGTLPTYPSLAELLLTNDGYHVPSFTPLFERIMAFTKQWGKFLTRLSWGKLEICEDEVLPILQPIIAVYQKFSIPLKGLPVGAVLMVDGVNRTVRNTIPPAMEEVFHEDWVDLHVRLYAGVFIPVPVKVEYSIPPGPCYGVGHEFRCTLHRIQRVMSDLGYFEIETLKTTIQISEQSADMLRFIFFGKGRLVHVVRCIKDPPPWYNEIIADEGPD
jgi:hypothetical protein